MNYDQLLKLKAAGFPIIFDRVLWNFQAPIEGSSTIALENEHFGYLTPSVYQMIEECRKLRNFKIYVHSDGFRIQLSEMEDDFEVCSSLEEALVELYVATKSF